MTDVTRFVAEIYTQELQDDGTARLTVYGVTTRWGIEESRKPVQDGLVDVPMVGGYPDYHVADRALLEQGWLRSGDWWPAGPGLYAGVTTETPERMARYGSSK
jgi:hypothetical protein